VSVTSRSGRLLLALLAGSAVLRIALAWSGGQYYFDDEGRYQRGVALYQALRAGDAAGLREQLQWPDHLAFNYVNTVVAALNHASAQLTTHSSGSVRLAAAVLSLFSVLNIWLVHRLARAGGAGEDEALWAAVLAAASNTLFYYSRHLLPYDCALSAALGALCLAVRAGPGWRHAAGGALTALSFQLYNGYWFLVPVVLLALGLSTPTWVARWRAGLAWAAGFLGSLTILLLPGLLAGGGYFWANLRNFSHTVLQGQFAEGWSLPGEYLWHSEGWLGLAVAAATGFAVCQAWPAGADAFRLRRWLLLLGATYLLPVAACVGWEKFVIYARTVRPLVPFFCLTGAYALHALAGWRPRLAPAAAVLVIGGALTHFAPHFSRMFPREAEYYVQQEYGMTKHALSFSGVIYRQLDYPVKRPDLALLNAQSLYPLRSYIGEPAGRVLFTFEHPLAYLPYQYEGHTPRERALLREHPPLIKLLQLTAPAEVPEHPPAALIFGDADRADGFDHARRP